MMTGAIKPAADIPVPRQNGHIMPGIIGDLSLGEAALMLADGNTVLLDDDAIGIGMDVHGTADSL